VSDWGDWLVGKNADDDDLWNDIAGLTSVTVSQAYKSMVNCMGKTGWYLPSKTAERIGLYFPQLSKDGAWELKTEYAKTKNCWYDHGAFQDGWSYDGALLVINGTRCAENLRGCETSLEC
jgi:hypothetical protein